MADTVWCGVIDDKLYKTSGDFTTTIKTSLSVGLIAGPTGVSWDGANSPWAGGNEKLYYMSGGFSSTIKGSQSASTSTWCSGYPRSLNARTSMLSGCERLMFHGSKERK